MKRKIISTGIFFLIAILSFPSMAQEAKRKRRFLVTGQYAGSIGFVSLGAGITSKRQRIHHEFMYGHVPTAYGGPTDKLTYKFSWYPISAQLTQGISWKILNPGMFVSKNFGDNFPVVHSRDKYERGYYWWTPGIRFHIAANSALTFRLSKKADRKLMLYLETNTNERYITTFFSATNASEMSVWELWQLGWGAKLMF